MKDQEGFDREILSDVQSERTHLKAELLRATNELAELRKRMDLARDIFYAITQEDGDDIDAIAEAMSCAADSGLFVCGHNTGDAEPKGWRNWEDNMETLASPPSPAPVESKPKPEGSK